MKRLYGCLAYVVIWPYVKFGLNSNRAYVLLIDKNLQEVCLVKKLVSWKNEWFLPGGGLKKNESYPKAACREIKEELGLELNPQKLREFCVLPGQNKFRPGQRVVFIYSFKKCALSCGGREIISVVWKPLSVEVNLNKYLYPALDKAIAVYKR